MYLLDPRLGRRRRALLRDKVIRLLRKVNHAADATLRDLAHRSWGVWKELGSIFEHKHREVSDEVLVERVRSKVGRVVSNPHSLKVDARHGRVILSGPVFVDEAGRLFSTVSHVHGVSDIEARLEKHSRSERVPGLQKKEKRVGSRIDPLQTTWSPATRFLAGTLGGSLALSALKRTDPARVAAGVMGVVFLARALTNRPLHRLMGFDQAPATSHTEMANEPHSHPRGSPRGLSGP
jgi:hypothetical protein